uniref:Uncharacterized protein n=1 Tax=Octopus bimaculoides TaxID=37653 RepID=A0A0L8GF23_OCTBM
MRNATSGEKAIAFDLYSIQQPWRQDVLSGCPNSTPTCGRSFLWYYSSMPIQNKLLICCYRYPSCCCISEFND